MVVHLHNSPVVLRKGVPQTERPWVATLLEEMGENRKSMASLSSEEMGPAPSLEEKKPAGFGIETLDSLVSGSCLVLGVTSVAVPFEPAELV
jgi:hypothetical protein